MLRSHHLQIGGEIFLAELQRIVLKAGHHFVCEALPGDIAPVGGNIFVERVVLQVALVEKGAAALPGERGHLPDFVLRELTKQRIAPLFVLRGEQKLQIALAGNEFIFFGGAALEAAHEVLNTFLSRGDGFPDANFVWYVAYDRETDLAGFRSRGEIGVVGNDALDFNEVDALSESTAATALSPV
jgi:hypothetical protein